MGWVISTREIRNGRWLVIYKVPAPCGCYFERKSKIFEKEPTQEQLNEIINQ